MTDEPGHRRPAVFDEAAEDYDAVRPSYPAALFDDLATLAGLPPDGHVLEIGCGTGQATVPLAQRGYRIMAVEMGAQLAAVARRKLAAYPRAEVVVGRFEDYPLEAGSFDLAIAATAFHWIDPAVRYARVVHALRPGGALAPFRNQHVTIDQDGGVFEAAQEVYWRVLPAWARAFPGLPRPEEVRDAEADQIAASGLFGPVVTRRYLWTAEYDAASYVRLLGTYSDYGSLEPATRRALFDGLVDLIDSRFSGRIVMGYLATLAVARRR